MPKALRVFVLRAAGDQPFIKQEQHKATRDSGSLVPGEFDDSATFNVLTASLEDHASLPRYPFLVLTPGIAYVGSNMANSNAQSSLRVGTVTPHVALSWDATHDRKTILALGYHHYVDPGSPAIAEFLGGGAPQRLCRLDPVAGDFSTDCRIQGGALSRTLGQPCGPDGFDDDGNRCECSTFRRAAAHVGKWRG